MRHFFRTMTVIIMIMVFSFSYSYAGMGSYMGNIMSQVSNLSPQAFQSQQRGYFVGGTMHVPPLGETIQPMSITLPSFNNNSCGGINAMMGGFSYLNFQYLVQKLQGIIQAAPALAFEIAIKVLSQQLGGVMNGLEQITDAINGLNFNSCTAMNGIVNSASSAINSAISSSAGASSASQSNGGSDWFGQSITNFANNIGSGITSLWNSISGGNPGSSTSSPQSLNTQESCGLPSGGLLNAAAQQMSGGLPSNFINVMRYYVGDVVPVPGSNGTSSTSQSTSTPSLSGIYATCGNPMNLPKDIVTGNVYEISYSGLENGQCDSVSATSTTPLSTIVNQDLTELYQALSTNQQITDPKIINLINMSSIPLYSFMRRAAVLNNSIVANGLIDQLSGPVAMDIADNVVTKMIGIVSNMASTIEAKTKISECPNTGYVDAIKEYKKFLIQFQYYINAEEKTDDQKVVSIYGSFFNEYQALGQQVQAQMIKSGSNLSKGFALQQSLQ